MITVKAQDGKFFFSSFLNLTSGQETQLEETELTLPDLKSLKVAIRTERLETSAEDELKVDAAITAKQPGTGGGVDPSVLLTKEDKINKVKVFGNGSDISYPTTNAVKSHVTSEINNLNISTYAKTSVVNTSLNSKADKTQLTSYALKTEIPSLEQTSGASVTPVLENRIPLYSLGTDGNFVLCTPNAWVKVGENLYMPAYTGEVLGLSPQ